MAQSKVWKASEKTIIPLRQAQSVALDLGDVLKDAGATRVQVAGSVRRKKPEVGDIDMVVLSPLPAGELLQKAEGVEVVQGGDEKAFGRYKGMPINVWRAKPEGWGAMLFYATGPDYYSGMAYRSRAKRAGLKLTQHGLFDKEGTQIAGHTEKSIYEALGKKYKSPHIRGEK